MKPWMCPVALVLMVPAAQAQPGPSPLFATFLKFCADPDLTPQKIRTTVEAAGGRLVGPPGSTQVPQPMYTVGWNVTVQGRQFRISATGIRAPYGPNRIQDNEQCSVMGDDSDGAAQTELKAWVGVPPYSPGSSYYDFVWDGQKRTPLVDGPTFRTDSEGGKSWTLAINGSGKFTTVMLTHFLKPAAKP